MTLIIGWANCIKVCRIRDRNGSSAASSAVKSKVTVPPKYAEVVLWYQVDFEICGIAPFGDEYLAVLAYIAERDDDASEDDDEPIRPELRIISRRDGEDISSDALPIRGFEHCAARDYGLCAAHRDIVSHDPGLDWDNEDADIAAQPTTPLPYCMFTVQKTSSLHV